MVDYGSMKLGLEISSGGDSKLSLGGDSWAPIFISYLMVTLSIPKP